MLHSSHSRQTSSDKNSHQEIFSNNDKIFTQKIENRVYFYEVIGGSRVQLMWLRVPFRNSNSIRQKSK